MKLTMLLTILAVITGPVLGLAQEQRISCDIMAKIDLKPLLGADHDKPVPFGENSCRAESAKPGRLVVISVQEGKPSELKQWLDGVRKINTTQLAGEVTVSSEPSLGPEAFSAMEKGKRGVEIYALKGNRAVTVQASWASGGPITEAQFKQLKQVAKTAVEKLP